MAVNDLSKTFGIPSPTETLDLTPQFQTSPETGTLGLEQPSTLTRVGSRLSNNLIRMGGYDPMQLSGEQQRKQARLAGLQELSYRLSQTAAKLSGDPARMQIAQQQEAQRIEAKQDQFKKRQIVEGPNGLKYYVNPDGSYERVFPGLEKTPTVTDSTESERNRSRYLELSKKENLNETEKLELRTLETDIFGNDLVPFFDKNRIQRATYTSAQIGKNPEIITQMEEQGLFSVGAKSAFATAGAANPVDDMAENWLTSKSQLNAINDLARLNYENRDSFTLAGSLADLVNTGVYQLESARRLGNLNKFADLNPEEYAKYNSRIDSLLNDKYGNILDKISQDRAVAKSIFLKLAYSTAKEIDPSGRLSDNDVKIAMDIIGQLGANWKANIAVLENLAKTSKSNYIDRYNMQYNNLKKEADITKAKQYADLPQFLGGIDWRNEGVIAPASLQGSQLRIDPEIDKLLKNQGI